MFCPMCREEVDKLEDSHFLPKQIYRRARNMVAEGKNLNMTDKEGNTFILSKEVKSYLLCKDCEGKLSKYGENSYARMCLPPLNRADVSKFFKIAKGKVIPFWNNASLDPRIAPNVSIGSGFLQGIDVDSIYYLAISILWRATFDVWNGCIPIKINEEAKEELRAYLLDPVNNDLSYKVEIAPSFWIQRYGTFFPVETKRPKFYFFSIFEFDFYIDLTTRVKKLSNNVPLHVLADPYRCKYAYEALKRTIVKAKPRGKVDKTISW
ncbi:hypothetical protein EU766_20725 [Salmonella enterica subsp. enterica serovar Typhimurium]|uniref:HNH endonuclease n=4 Tax=Salmonella enterica TaxID=28901 RepID=A0A601Z3B0_SALTM|nr:hypothetical protein [Salmonella enterica]EAN1004202.1 hypothetical protein [Salmonella enterica subsp. enterica serovar Typhimurium var. 5-]EEA9062763.1 hypothetical protein [Salmonella enterica subsp. enterica]EFU9453945.1 hypothetical protein [Salmonella enterica subsp. enterica serovar Worthington]CRJ41876.1 Uncharacterised protein [Salmonella enterica subsp. enterica serovar Typhi]HAD4280005.1 hypothetical protein [Salmonella enterica subsp. enterica serovar Typhi str. CT18]HCJ7760824